MRRGIGRAVAVVILGTMLVHHSPPAASKPMSGDLIPPFQVLELLLESVVCGSGLNEAETRIVNSHLRGKATPLFWLAAYITGEAEDESGELLAALRDNIPDIGRRSPGHAFAAMALLKRDYSGKPKDEQLKALRALEGHDDHYLRIAAAKQMIRIDPDQAIDTLKRMNKERASILLHSESDRLIRKIKGELNPGNPWIGGEQYAMVVRTTEPSAAPGFCKTGGNSRTKGGGCTRDQ